MAAKKTKYTTATLDSLAMLIADKAASADKSFAALSDDIAGVKRRDRRPQDGTFIIKAPSIVLSVSASLTATATLATSTDATTAR